MDNLEKICKIFISKIEKQIDEGRSGEIYVDLKETDINIDSLKKLEIKPYDIILIRECIGGGFIKLSGRGCMAVTYRMNKADKIADRIENDEIINIRTLEEETSVPLWVLRKIIEQYETEGKYSFTKSNEIGQEIYRKINK